MNYSKLLISSLIGGIVSFFVGWAIYGILLKDTMSKAMTPEANAINKTDMNLLGVFISGLVYSFLLAYIFERWAQIRTFASGAIAGGIIGCLIAMSFDIQLWAMLNMYADATYIPVDIAAATVMAALMGGAIGWFLGFNRNEG